MTIHGRSGASSVSDVGCSTSAGAVEARVDVMTQLSRAGRAVRWSASLHTHTIRSGMAVGSHHSGLPAARAIVPSAITPSALLGHSGVRRAPRTKVGAFVALTKPRIIELLLVSTVPTMILAAEGLPSPGLILATLVGGTLAAG